MSSSSSPIALPLSLPVPRLISVTATHATDSTVLNSSSYITAPLTLEPPVDRYLSVPLHDPHLHHGLEINQAYSFVYAPNGASASGLGGTLTTDDEKTLFLNNFLPPPWAVVDRRHEEPRLYPFRIDRVTVGRLVHATVADGPAATHPQVAYQSARVISSSENHHMSTGAPPDTHSDPRPRLSQALGNRIYSPLPRTLRETDQFRGESRATRRTANGSTNKRSEGNGEGASTIRRTFTRRRGRHTKQSDVAANVQIAASVPRSGEPQQSIEPNAAQPRSEEAASAHQGAANPSVRRNTRRTRDRLTNPEIERIRHNLEECTQGTMICDFCTFTATKGSPTVRGRPYRPWMQRRDHADEVIRDLQTIAVERGFFITPGSAKRVKCQLIVLFAEHNRRKHFRSEGVEPE